MPKYTAFFLIAFVLVGSFLPQITFAYSGQTPGLSEAQRKAALRAAEQDLKMAKRICSFNAKMQNPAANGPKGPTRKAALRKAETSEQSCVSNVKSHYRAMRTAIRAGRATGAGAGTEKTGNTKGALPTQQ